MALKFLEPEKIAAMKVGPLVPVSHRTRYMKSVQGWHPHHVHSLGSAFSWRFQRFPAEVARFMEERGCGIFSRIFSAYSFCGMGSRKHSPSGMPQKAAFLGASASIRPRQKAFQVFEKKPWRDVVRSVWKDHRTHAIHALSIGKLRSDDHSASS